MAMQEMETYFSKMGVRNGLEMHVLVGGRFDASLT